MGFSHAWTYDHLVWADLPDSPWFAAVPTLAAAAGVTSTIGLGTFVSSPNYRHPYTFARDVLTLDDVSGGRFLCGLGAGGDLDAGILGEDHTLGNGSTASMSSCRSSTGCCGRTGWTTSAPGTRRARPARCRGRSGTGCRCSSRRTGRAPSGWPPPSATAG